MRSMVVPRLFCVCGTLLLLYFAISGAITGEAFGKFGKLHRTHQPIGYWVVLISQFGAAGLLFYAALHL